MEEIYIQRCLQLAAQGREKAAPNPMVGAVIVHNGKIIGEGFHTACGFAHAEVEAINSVADHSLLKESTMYVSLEPCSHYGKTPPCAKLIIEKQIPKVVIGTLDPFPAVSGNGVKMLEAAGVNVRVGVNVEECRSLNKAFFCFLEKKRPYIVLKWAQTKDGFIDKIRNEGEKPHPTPISNEMTRTHVHKLRSELQSILVGTNTAINDNPSLTVRFWSGNNPTRLLLDRKLRVPSNSILFNGKVPTLIFTEKEKENSTNCEYVRIDFSNNPVLEILNILYRRNIQSLLVEGGRQLLQSFIDFDLWDEVQVEVADLTFDDGIAAPKFEATPHSTEQICNSMMYHYIR
ncbi:MAG: bifunctional diaminohydroxyphosphoribosylaminopyrimidine deaminase/5-amino-6-(5-phosphoribosylamino)uracil reductase RibD [Bacteroidales bacterium]|nr:bifunctional diaminohydroxyphosphoribosylaminopyrimidine deaminase/5-amino-6-(5-phosphoribosylamino)uracil reductase RibD [Bacteroidales bacterium]